jgi:hypothetical protein
VVQQKLADLFTKYHRSALDDGPVGLSEQLFGTSEQDGRLKGWLQWAFPPVCDRNSNSPVFPLGGIRMSLNRTAVSVASIFLGLALVISMPPRASAQVIHACVNNSSGDMKIVPAGATCQRNWAPLSWNVQGPPGPPGQGATVLVDANGNTVGRLYFTDGNPLGLNGSYQYVLRQINGIWVAIPVTETGFQSIGPPPFQYWYQSADCTGQAYLMVNQAIFGGPSPGPSSPAAGYPATLPPANIPSIYFAGTPSILTLNSYQNPPVPPFAGMCFPWTNGPSPTVYAGIPQSVPVSSLGLTLPFSVK